MRKGKKNGRRPKRFLQDEQDEILQKNEGKKKSKVQICLLMIVTIVLWSKLWTFSYKILPALTEPSLEVEASDLL